VVSPLVTVLINNHNYGRFLATAIESAIAQTYRHLEIVVVDDGSTDDSRAVITRYGDRINAVSKGNGGQASAFNVGFARSRGQIVTLLDADDVLDPSLVERVVEAFATHHDAGLVQCRLRLADAEGTPTGAMVPPSYVRMPTEDLRLRPDALNNGSWWAPTSGISVSSSVLARVLPLPEDLFRISADIGLIRASALCAPVVSIGGTAGLYRSHGANYANAAKLNLRRIESDARRFVEQQRFLRGFADSVGVVGYPPDPYAVSDPVFAIQRALLVKLGRDGAALPGDTPLSVCRRGIHVAVSRPDVGRVVKALLVGWFSLMTVLPRPLAARLATRTLTRGRPVAPAPDSLIP
jgi:glycosyltransferase involved in cell wall biosynthesis